MSVNEKAPARGTRPRSPVDPAELQRRGLYDPAAPNASDRLALLEYLAGLGFSIDAMAEAHRQNRLVHLSANAVVGNERANMSFKEVCRKAGIPEELALRVWTASGLPPLDRKQARFGDEDVALFVSFLEGAAVFGEKATIEFTRVLGSAMARLADAAVSTFQVELAAPLGGAGELALAMANYRAAESLTVLPTVMDVLFLRQLEVAIERSEQAREEGAYGAYPLAVGFVDLVGFTPLSRQRSTQELSELIAEFEGRASDLTATHGGRLVKLIGDEAMFVTVELEGACDVALTLVETFGEDSTEITPRGGVAYGDLLSRGGDYYGITVNVAARVAELAVPGEILAPADVVPLAKAEGASGFSFEPAGRRLLKGFDQPMELVAVRRAEPGHPARPVGRGSVDAG